MLGIIGAAWGVIGFVLLLLSAVMRLTPIAAEALAGPLAPRHWVALLLMLAFMIYSEGYRGFQRSLAPRFASRAAHLRAHPRWLHVLLAPLFCVGYFHVRRRRQIVVWSLTATIAALIVGVHYVGQPWRGLIDASVVVGLLWGIGAILVCVARVARGESLAHAAELPPERGDV
jgi:hypothetical protein